MGLNRGLSSIQSDRARANIKKCNLIHSYYEKNHEAIDKSAGECKEEIDNRFLSIIKNHEGLIKTEEAQLNRNLTQIRAEYPKDFDATLPFIQNKTWSGMTKYLPFVENESIYLLYKKMQHFLNIHNKKAKGWAQASQPAKSEKLQALQERVRE